MRTGLTQQQIRNCHVLPPKGSAPSCMSQTLVSLYLFIFFFKANHSLTLRSCIETETLCFLLFTAAVKKEDRNLWDMVAPFIYTTFARRFKPTGMVRNIN